MADVIYGWDRGEVFVDVSRGGASPGKGLEVVIDDAVSLTKQEVLNGLDIIRDRIFKNDNPF